MNKKDLFTLELQNKIQFYNEREKNRINFLKQEEENLLMLNLDLQDYRNILSTTSANKYSRELVKLKGIQFGTDILLGTWSKDSTNHRVVDVECTLCHKRRKVISSIFFSERPLKYQMCSCQKYSPTSIKEYKDTIRGTDIFVGLGPIQKGNQKIWIKCIVCDKYRCVNGIDYLKYKCINECNHLKKDKKVQLNKQMVYSIDNKVDNKSKYSDIKYKGEIFNDLQVVDFYKLKKDTQVLKYKEGVYWGCNCLLCNSYTIQRATDVYNGVIKNCGCKNRRFFEKYKIGDFVDVFEIKDIIKVEGDATYWAVQCPYCENTFVRKATDICLGHFKSCGCKNRSLGELIIKEILEEMNIEYYEQVSFKDLKNGLLRFDFMLKRGKKKFLIEFDGVEHYYESAQFVKKNKKQIFEVIQENDSLKNNYCKNKGIPLLRIKTTTNKEEIKRQIMKFIGGFEYD